MASLSRASSFGDAHSNLSQVLDIGNNTSEADRSDNEDIFQETDLPPTNAPPRRRQSVLNTVVNVVRGVVSRLSVTSMGIPPTPGRTSVVSIGRLPAVPQIKFDDQIWKDATPVPAGASALEAAHVHYKDSVEDGSAVAERLLSGTDSHVLDPRWLVFAGGLECQYLESRTETTPTHFRALSFLAFLLFSGFVLFTHVRPPFENDADSFVRAAYRTDASHYASVAGAAAGLLLVGLSYTGAFVVAQRRMSRVLLTVAPFLVGLTCLFVQRFMVEDPSFSGAWILLIVTIPLIRERMTLATAALLVTCALNIAQVVLSPHSNADSRVMTLLPMSLSALFPAIAVYTIDRRLRWQWLAMRNAEATRENLKREKDQMEKLLSHQLPAPIIARVRLQADAKGLGLSGSLNPSSHGKPRRPQGSVNIGHAEIAERFPGVTVIFVELAHWYDRTQSIAPDKAVAILNAIFTRFDTLTEVYGVEKIKTMGPSYLACVGAPVVRDNHTEIVTRFALNLLGEWAEEGEKLGLDLRIGIHVGEVVAGIVGTLRFCYDIYGDTVNTASRMCKHSPENKIHCTQEVYDILVKTGHFSFICAGASDFKGKGSLTTYYITGCNEDVSHLVHANAALSTHSTMSPPMSPVSEGSTRRHSTSTGLTMSTTQGSKQTVSSSEYSAALANFSETIRISHFLDDDPTMVNAQVAAMMAALSPRGSFSMPVLAMLPPGSAGNGGGNGTSNPHSQAAAGHDRPDGTVSVAVFGPQDDDGRPTLVRTKSSHSAVSRRSFSVGDTPPSFSTGGINTSLPGATATDTLAAIRHARSNESQHSGSSSSGSGVHVNGWTSGGVQREWSVESASGAALDRKEQSSSEGDVTSTTATGALVRRQGSMPRLPRSMSGRDLTPFAEEAHDDAGDRAGEQALPNIERTASSFVDSMASSTSIIEEGEDELGEDDDSRASFTIDGAVEAYGGNFVSADRYGHGDGPRLSSHLAAQAHRGSFSRGESLTPFRKLSHLSAAGATTDEALVHLEQAMRSSNVGRKSSDMGAAAAAAVATRNALVMTGGALTSAKRSATSSSLISRDFAMKLALSKGHVSGQHANRAAKMSRLTLSFRDRSVEHAFRLNGALHSRRLTAVYFACAWAFMMVLVAVDVLSRPRALYGSEATLRFALVRAIVGTVAAVACCVGILRKMKRSSVGSTDSMPSFPPRAGLESLSERRMVMASRESQPIVIAFLCVYIALLLGLQITNGALENSTLCGMDAALLYVDCILLGVPSILFKTLLFFGGAYALFVVVILAVGSTSLNLATGILCCSTLFIVCVTHYVFERRQRRQFSVDMQTCEQEMRVRSEKRVGEQLLFNILPASIAQMLADNSQSNTARSFSAVTVLVMDIAGFTAMSSAMTAPEVVRLLNDIFNRFDERVNSYDDIEKIATIGDAYIAASGVPQPCADHAFQICSLGVDMLLAVVEYNDEQRGASQSSAGAHVRVRIGIHSGSCIAGILGGKIRFKYDLYGDAVHVAQTLEQTGVPGCLHVTRETLALIEPMRLLSIHQFTADDRPEPVAIHENGIERVVRTVLLHHIIPENP